MLCIIVISAKYNLQDAFEFRVPVVPHLPLLSIFFFFNNL